MDRVFEHLGPFSDMVSVAQLRGHLFPKNLPPRLNRAGARRLLSFVDNLEPGSPKTERTWTRDGVDGEEVSWSVAYGPRTHAWILRPAGERAQLPGILALHSHDSFKFFGKEKIADGPEETHPLIIELREKTYEGTAYANELAKIGFTVLVHDTFMWGSRRFPPQAMPPLRRYNTDGTWEPEDIVTDKPTDYNRLARQHEHVLAKYLTVLGTSLPAVVSYEDLVAATYLRQRSDIVGSASLGVIGMSGGGCRATFLKATSQDVGPTVVVGMMTSYFGLLDRHVQANTWILYPPGLALVGDWPDLAAAGAPSPLMAQYCLNDHLFTVEGMESADFRLRNIYDSLGASFAYEGEFYPVPHMFSRIMQASAFSFLQRNQRG